MKTWQQVAVITALAVVALSAICGVAAYATKDGGNPATTVSAQTPFPSPSPTIDRDREACHRLSLAGDLLSVAPDEAVMRPVGASAALATDSDIKAAGLAMAPIYAYDGPQPGNESVEAYRVSAELQLACAARFGEGPW